MLPGQERSIMRRNIDLPLMVGRENPESAASAAFAALSEHRFNRGQ